MHKYKVKEFTPKSNQPGTHSFYVEAAPFQTLTNAEMAKKIEARTGFKRYEVDGILKAYGEIMKEELAEGSAMQMEDENGDVIVKFQAKASYSVTDKDVEERTTEAHKKDASVAIRKVAEASDIVSSDINWRVSATVGINFSKNAAIAIRKAGTKRQGEVEKTDVAPETPSDNTTNTTTPEQKPGNNGTPPSTDDDGDTFI